ncbi:golgin subfamily A member 6-like protein 25 [Scomber scombrus]|uniref:Golgin subfamily A member 6-like protein 25 n=1 Tax=Scomber scombrus TaxID=13677 RepID=A0AAV1QCA3_SCOSC
MENINIPRDQVFGQMSELQYLRQAFLSSQADIQKLTTENAALKQQMATKEQSWENERRKLLPDHRQALVTEVRLTTAELDKVVDELKLKRELYELRCEMDRKVTEKEDEVRFVTLQNQELLDELRCEMDRKVKEKEDEVHSVKLQNQALLDELRCELDQKVKEKEDEVRSVILQNQEILDKMKDWEKEYDDLKDFSKRENEKVFKTCEIKIAALKDAYEQTAIDLNSEWQNRLLEKENVIAGLEDDAQEVAEENTALKAAIREKMVALAECMAKLAVNKPQLAENKTKWKRRFEYIKEQLDEEVAGKRVYLLVAHEMQKDQHRLEEQWHLKVKQLEEKIKLLTNENTDLQLYKKKQQALKKRRKELKEQREAERKEREQRAIEDEGKDEKQLKTERKEREKKEKTEKKEREKAEKERLKREQKDRKEREKREKKERKEAERRNR